MNPLSNLVNSSVFTYKPKLLTRPYQYLTTKASIELNHIMCVSLDISVLSVKFGDQACVCRIDTPTSHKKQTCCPSAKVPWLFDELSDNNALDDGLSLSASVAVNKLIWKVILTLGSDAILVTYQINTCYTITYAHDGAFPHFN